MKYPNLDLGTIEAVFNKLGGMEGAQAFLRGERNLVSTTTSERPQLEHHLLETVSTVALDAVERFNAKD
ncbi:MAG: hypothetical protein ACREGH_02675, partial [Minisyncoccia bacterium]